MTVLIELIGIGSVRNANLVSFIFLDEIKNEVWDRLTWLWAELRIISKVINGKTVKNLRLL